MIGYINLYLFPKTYATSTLLHWPLMARDPFRNFGANPKALETKALPACAGQAQSLRSSTCSAHHSAACTNQNPGAHNLNPGVHTLAMGAISTATCITCSPGSVMSEPTTGRW